MRKFSRLLPFLFLKISALLFFSHLLAKNIRMGSMSGIVFCFSAFLRFFFPRYLFSGLYLHDDRGFETKKLSFFFSNAVSFFLNPISLLFTLFILHLI